MTTELKSQAYWNQKTAELQELAADLEAAKGAQSAAELDYWRTLATYLEAKLEYSEDLVQDLNDLLGESVSEGFDKSEQIDELTDQIDRLEGTISQLEDQISQQHEELEGSDDSVMDKVWDISFGVMDKIHDRPGEPEVYVEPLSAAPEEEPEPDKARVAELVQIHEDEMARWFSETETSAGHVSEASESVFKAP